MKRYFFDVVSQSRAEYDYSGLEFPSPEKARQLAELMALDLQVCPQGDWDASTVSVRDCLGQLFFSMRVRPPELVAA
jgi:hypothetical protein